jgi:hypothetical protein
MTIRSAAIGFLSWLLPAGGYLFERRYAQFAASFALICGAFLAGIALQGGGLWIGPGELDGLDGFTSLIARAGVLGKALAGAPYVLTLLLFQSPSYVEGRLHEYGTVLLLCAGIMNILALADAFELRSGR